jgi:hypothetical protein
VWACHTTAGRAENGAQAGTYSHLCNRELSNLRPDKVLDTWQVLVAQFSARVLTHATDCLPALSGLAQKFHSQMGWKYVAGLWEEHLAVGLCWEVERSVVRTEPVMGTMDINSVKYVAPTWSWASAGQRVCFWGGWGRGLRYQNLVVVDDVCCQIDGLNPFGRIAGGYLTLRGTAFTMLLSQKSVTRHDTPMRQPTNSVPDAVIAEDCTLVLHGTTLRRARDSDSFTSFSDTSVLCMLLGRHPRSSTSDDEAGGGWHYGLILGDSGKDGAYHRLGLATFTEQPHFTGEEMTVRVE